MVGAGSRRWWCLLGLAVSLVAIGAVARADQTSAMRLYAAKHYGEAFQQFLPLAEGGNPVAQFYIAVMFDNGQSVAVDHTTAAGWYRRAAAQGHGDAQLRLASMLRGGEGVATDPREALTWVLCALQQPLPTASRARAERLRDVLIAALPLAQRQGAEAEAVAWVPRQEALAPAVPAERTEEGPRLRKRGTGFFVDAAGHLVTAYHVIDDCAELRLSQPAGGGSLRLVAADALSELALLTASLPATDHVVFSARPVVLGAGVVIVGYPFVAPELMVTNGIVNARVGSRGEPGVVQLSAGLVPGASGSPVFDESGAVLGVAVRRTTGAATGDQPEVMAGSVAVALPVVLRFLAAQDVAVTTADAHAPLALSEIVARGGRAAVALECWR